MRQIASYLLVFLLWNVGVSAALLTGMRLGLEFLGLALSLLLYAGVLHGYLLRGPPGRRRLLRLRPLSGDTLRWTVLAVPVMLLLSWALGEVYIRVVPVPQESFDPFGPMMRTAPGRLSITILAVGIAPVLEEFFFRGLIQQSLVRRWGPVGGILGAGWLFALIHLLPWVLPLHLFLGVVFGYVVYVTRSIWSGVVLHAANNAAAMAGLGFQGEEPVTTATIWQTGTDRDWWLSLAALAVAAMLAARTARELRAAGRGTRLRGGKSTA